MAGANEGWTSVIQAPWMRQVSAAENQLSGALGRLIALYEHRVFVDTMPRL